MEGLKGGDHWLRQWCLFFWYENDRFDSRVCRTGFYIFSNFPTRFPNCYVTFRNDIVSAVKTTVCVVSPFFFFKPEECVVLASSALAIDGHELTNGQFTWRRWSQNPRADLIHCNTTKRQRGRNESQVLATGMITTIRQIRTCCSYSRGNFILQGR